MPLALIDNLAIKKKIMRNNYAVENFPLPKWDLETECDSRSKREKVKWTGRELSDEDAKEEQLLYSKVWWNQRKEWSQRKGTLM